MNIIKSDIIGAQYDAFWENTSALANVIVQKPVLIIVADCPEHSPQDVQLQKMLEACKLAALQYNIVRLGDGQQVAWHQLRGQAQPKVVFLIGIMPHQLGVSVLFKLNERNNFGGCTWLPTVSLSDLDKNPDMKKQLWVNGMKPIFIDGGLI